MTGRMLAMIGAMLAVLLPVPAAAQFSDSYNFLKAVRDRDGGKVTELLGTGSTIVDTRDRSTGETGLHIVTKRRDATWLRFLLGRGASPDIRDSDGNTALMMAARLGFAEGAQILLASGAGVNVTNGSGETPLIAAVQNRDAATVRVLLAAGADPKKADTLAGMSARDYAERDGRSRIILDMIDGAKPAPSGPVSGPK